MHVAMIYNPMTSAIRTWPPRRTQVEGVQRRAQLRATNSSAVRVAGLVHGEMIRVVVVERKVEDAGEVGRCRRGPAPEQGIEKGRGLCAGTRVRGG